MKRDRFSRTRVAAAVAGIGCAMAGSQALGAGIRSAGTERAAGSAHAYRRRRGRPRRTSARYFSIRRAWSRLPSTQVSRCRQRDLPVGQIHDSGSQPAAFQPLGGNGGEAGGCAGCRTCMSACRSPTNGRSAWASNVPFGLETEYDSDWLGRFQAIKSKLETINVNPALSWEPTPRLTVGAGVSWQRI